MSRPVEALPTHPGAARVLGHACARGCGWGAVGGAISGVVYLAALVLANGPPEAVIVYPWFAAVPGAVVGLVVGAVAATALVVVRPSTVAGSRWLAGAVSGALVSWPPAVVALESVADVLLWLYLVTLGVGWGALLAPRISARRNGAAAAAGRASPGSSRAPGR